MDGKKNVYNQEEQKGNIGRKDVTDTTAHVSLASPLLASE